jgi:hypothetical protein
MEQQTRSLQGIVSEIVLCQIAKDIIFDKYYSWDFKLISLPQ